MIAGKKIENSKDGHPGTATIGFWIYPVRIFQVIVALIVFGLSAYGMSRLVALSPIWDQDGSDLGGSGSHGYFTFRLHHYSHVLQWNMECFPGDTSACSTAGTP
jgi:hypothetical protein